jgi:hypothetical protein
MRIIACIYANGIAYCRGTLIVGMRFSNHIIREDGAKKKQAKSVNAQTVIH